MGFLPWLGSMPQLDKVLQQVQGVVAAIVGQTYDVRRLTDTTNVSVSSNSPVFSSFPASIIRTTKKEFLENQIFELIVFLATCDNRELVLMDQFTETGYKAMPQGTYVLAEMRPMNVNIFMRAEANISISHPLGTSLTGAQQPVSGTVYNGDGAWSGVWKENDQILTLVNGLYAWSSDPSAEAAQVACALSPNSRIKDGNTLGTPTEQYRDQFLCWLPMLPGVMLNELDRLNFGQGDRYEIAKFFTTDETGLSGQFMVVEKLGGS